MPCKTTPSSPKLLLSTSLTYDRTYLDLPCPLSRLHPKPSNFISVHHTNRPMSLTNSFLFSRYKMTLFERVVHTSILGVYLTISVLGVKSVAKMEMSSYPEVKFISKNIGRFCTNWGFVSDNSN